MWSQYLRTQEGIAVQSTYERLCQSLAGYEDFQINIGMVNYIDYESDSIPNGNAIYPTMYKRKRRVAQAFDLAGITTAEGCPVLRVFLRRAGVGNAGTKWV